MTTKKKVGLPPDWQAQVQEFIRDYYFDKKMVDGQEMDVAKNVPPLWGLSFPQSWRSELTLYVRDGQLYRMFKVKRFSFSGSSISVLEEPKEAPAA